MSPTIKWQRWDSASYNWYGTTSADALPSIEAELDAWIATVNLSAVNAGRQITKEKGYADSTATNYAGTVISAGANNNTQKGYLFYGTMGGSSKKIYTGDVYTDDGSNGGYGTISGGSIDTFVTWYVSGQEASFMITFSTVPGEEFFTFGPIFGSQGTSYMDGFHIIKCSDGEWSMYSSDGSSVCHIHYFDDPGGGVWSSCSRSTTVDSITTAGSFYYRSFAISKSTDNGTSSVDPATDGASLVIAASPFLLEPNTGYNTTGRRRILTDLGDGTNVYVLAAAHYGPHIVVDLRA